MSFELNWIIFISVCLFCFTLIVITNIITKSKENINRVKCTLKVERLRLDREMIFATKNDENEEGFDGGNGGNDDNDGDNDKNGKGGSSCMTFNRLPFHSDN